jgi:ubiquinone/menaquinone biosynthesis C-methylase UbiE
LIADARGYDKLSGFLFGRLFQAIAADIASETPPGSRILEAGCGPGHLSIRLARDHQLDVTGIDLDPSMIARARANAERSAWNQWRPPRFDVGNAAAMTFGGASFDLVVSTLSMHHWSDAPAGLAEVARVLRPGGKALIWDLKAGSVPFHTHAPDPARHVHASPLRIVSNTPWRWPWRLSFLQRLELARA